MLTYRYLTTMGVSKISRRYYHPPGLGLNGFILIVKIGAAAFPDIVKIKHKQQYAMQGLIVRYLRKDFRVPVGISAMAFFVSLGVDFACAKKVAH